MDLVELYCSADDFWKTFKRDWDRHLIDTRRAKRGPEPELTAPEMMTIGRNACDQIDEKISNTSMTRMFYLRYVF